MRRYPAKELAALTGAVPMLSREERGQLFRMIAKAVGREAEIRKQCNDLGYHVRNRASYIELRSRDGDHYHTFDGFNEVSEFILKPFITVIR